MRNVITGNSESLFCSSEKTEEIKELQETKGKQISVSHESDVSAVISFTLKSRRNIMTFPHL